MWWRAHDEALDDPKLQRLTGDLFKAWFNLMCLASRNEGRLPALADVAFGLRLTEAKAAEMVTLLERARLLDKTETGFEPHNWNARQFKSDVSTARVKRFRERKAAVAETAPEQSRAEAEQKTEIRAVEADPPRHDPGSVKLLSEELFDELWAMKPRRDGANPRKPAFEKFRRLIHGNPVETAALGRMIIDAAKRWAAEEQRRAVVGTDKVAQLITWLNQARWEGYAAPVPDSPAAVPGFYATEASEQLAAWDAHWRSTKGTNAPRDRNFGWRFPTEWPPGAAGNSLADLDPPAKPTANGSATRFTI